jgi:hypothetical protein
MFYVKYKNAKILKHFFQPFTLSNCDILKFSLLWFYSWSTWFSSLTECKLMIEEPGYIHNQALFFCSCSRNQFETCHLSFSSMTECKLMIEEPWYIHNQALFFCSCSCNQFETCHLSFSSLTECKLMIEEPWYIHNQALFFCSCSCNQFETDHLSFHIFHSPLFHAELCEYLHLTWDLCLCFTCFSFLKIPIWVSHYHCSAFYPLVDICWTYFRSFLRYKPCQKISFLISTKLLFWEKFLNIQKRFGICSSLKVKC